MNRLPWNYGTAKGKLAYARVQQLCQQLNQPLSPPVLRALALLTLGTPDVAQAAQWAEQLLRIARAEGNPFLLAEGHYMVGVVPFWRGDLIQAKSHLERALAYYDPNNSSLHIRLYGQDLQVVCLARLALVLWYLGYPAQALHMMEKAQVRAHEIAHPVTLAYALCFASWLYNDCRQRPAGEKTAKQLLTLGHELGLAWWQAAGNIFCGWIDVQRDDTQRGLALILEGIEGYHVTEQDTYRPYMLSLLAQSYQHMGNIAQALSTVETALEFAAATGQCFWDAELYRLRGELSWMLGKEESQVEANYCQALELARQQQAKALELRAAISLSRLWHKQGQSEKARHLLAHSYNWFTEGFDLPDLLDASALLD